MTAHFRKLFQPCSSLDNADGKVFLLNITSAAVKDDADFKSVHHVLSCTMDDNSFRQGSNL